MRIAILTANLGNFDIPVDPVNQILSNWSEADVIKFHRFTDENFPPITGLTPRMQYRLCKMFGWELFPGYDVYIWLDGSVTFQRRDCLEWYLEQLGTCDAAFFRHPQRGTIKQEVAHIEEKLQQRHWYMIPRYENGLHKEMYELIKKDSEYKDEKLFASTTFIYKNNEKIHEAMEQWWFYQSRYYTCDQVSLPYALDKAKTGLYISVIQDNLYKIGYLSLVSKHK